MALAYLVVGVSPSWCVGFSGDRRRASRPAIAFDFVLLGDKVTVCGCTVGSRREVRVSARLKAAVEVPTVESGGKVGSGVEIPVTCYQILGVPGKAEKDEVVKAAMVLKNSEVEDGYTEDIIVSRQDLLVDVRDKLLFEPEYTGNIKEKLPPKSSLRIPWSWLPAVLCLLQEVGEEKLVLEIGRAALQMPDIKPYIHDLLFSIALAECSIAKASFEKNKVSEGFEALARAQYLLKSKASLGKMPLLTQIEESLEELAPACTLELLGIPHTPENSERRRGAIQALRELVRQGLDIETSCRVQDWPCFFSQAMKKLMASEIVDLISWDALAFARKNKKSLESQNQRVVIDFDCFYMAMIAHIALGFSTRQTDLISKAKHICECLIAADSVDLKFEEAFCSLLLGQGNETVAVEKLRQLLVNGNSALRRFESNILTKEFKEKGTATQFLETWLKDAVLCVFLDTRDCLPYLADFFGGPKRMLHRGSKQNRSTSKPVPSFSHRTLSAGLSHDTLNDQHHTNSTHLGESVIKQLAPAHLQSQLNLDKTSGNPSGPSVKLKRDLGLHQTKIWETLSITENLSGRISHILIVGCIILSAFKLFSLQLGHRRVPHKWLPNNSKISSSSAAWTIDSSQGSQRKSFIDRNLFGLLGKLLIDLKQNLKHRTNVRTVQDKWPTDDLSSLTTASVITGTLQTTQMSLEEAEALVKKWQEIKAEALGPNHEIQILPEILAGSMLSKWQDLANSAKARSCFWRFVLLQLSILRADIGTDDEGCEFAEIEALLEEAAELVDESQPKKPTYYSTYKVQYILKRHDDGSWRVYSGGIQNPV